MMIFTQRIFINLIKNSLGINLNMRSTMNGIILEDINKIIMNRIIKITKEKTILIKEVMSIKEESS